MNKQYQALGKSLFFFYMTRLIGIGIIYFVSFGYINSFFVYYRLEFPNQSSRMKFDKMVNVLQTSKQTMSAIANMAETVVKQNSKIQDINYCQSNQSYSQCSKFILSSLDNQLIYKTYGTFTSFTCLVGDCSEVSILWDYFWTFKIRLQFIDYIVIEYDKSGGKQKLVVPACSNISSELIDLSSTQSWIFYRRDNLLYMTMNSKASPFKLKVTIIYDVLKLKKEYGIQLNDYQINPQSIKPNPAYLTHQIQGIQIFGYLSSQQKFIMNKWVYNILAILGIFTFSVPLLYFLKILIASWQTKLFKHLQPLNNLYKYQINAIFGGQKPKKSAILSQTTFTYFFEDLSEIIQKDCQPLVIAPQAIEKQDSFKFTLLIDRVMLKFEESLKPLQQQRTRQLSNLKPLIRSSVNDISEHIKQKLRELFMKSRQLLLLPQFFYFGYLSLLSSTQVYQQVIRSQRTPLTDSMINLFRYLNYTVNTIQLKFAFKFAFIYNHIIEQQILMKLHDSLLQKYLSALKDLDVGDPNYAVRLGLKTRLNNLEKIIQNKKHIFSAYLK